MKVKSHMLICLYFPGPPIPEGKVSRWDFLHLEVALSNQWFRMYSEYATDAKVQSMPEHMQRRLVMLFCLRCCDVTVTLSDEDLAFQLRISDEQLAETKQLFLRKGFINDDWDLVNWDKRQFVSDSSTERTRAYRQRKKERDELLKKEAETSRERHSDALDTDTEQIQKQIQKIKNTVAPLVLPQWLPPEDWKRFVDYRKKSSGKKFTAEAEKLNLTALAKLVKDGQDPIAVIDQSIAKGWSGLFAVKEQSLGNRGASMDQTLADLQMWAAEGSSNG